MVLAILLIVILLAIKKPSQLAAPQVAAESWKQQAARTPNPDESVGAGEHGRQSRRGKVQLSFFGSECRTCRITWVEVQRQRISARCPIPGAPISFEGDQVRGIFPTQIYGKDVYVTVAGRLGSQNGYATFDPTEFKVGDLTIPVSLVNGPLQKNLRIPPIAKNSSCRTLSPMFVS